MLHSQHRDADVCVGEGGDLRCNAFDFISENQANGKRRLPIEQLDRFDPGFNGNDLVMRLAKVLDSFDSIAAVLPTNAAFRS